MMWTLSSVVLLMLAFCAPLLLIWTVLALSSRDRRRARDAAERSPTNEMTEP
jgi:hypothetical protein